MVRSMGPISEVDMVSFHNRMSFIFSSYVIAFHMLEYYMLV